MAAPDDSIQQLIRQEMGSIMAELTRTKQTRANGQQSVDLIPFQTANGDKDVTNAAISERMQLLRDRITVLEDVLAKSETDRAAVYSKFEQVSHALRTANEEKLALMHEFHDSSHGPVAELTMLLNTAREENDRLRQQLTVISDRYDTEVPTLRNKIREMDGEIRKLRKLSKSAKEERYESVTIADLHYSNERLSAQLSKVQAPAVISAQDEAKMRECEQAIQALTSETAALEQKMVSMRRAHEGEVTELRQALERQYNEFSIERAECDKVVGIMGAKLEALIGENQFLKNQIRSMNNRTPTRRESTRT
jgi:hypothetical protein